MHMLKIIYKSHFTEQAACAANDSAKGENNGKGLPAVLLLPPDRTDEPCAVRADERDDKRNAQGGSPCVFVKTFVPLW